jgi:hypothetical protein
VGQTLTNGALVRCQARKELYEEYLVSLPPVDFDALLDKVLRGLLGECVVVLVVPQPWVSVCNFDDVSKVSVELRPPARVSTSNYVHIYTKRPDKLGDGEGLV